MTELKILDEILKQLEKATEDKPIKMEKLFWDADKLFETSSRLRFTVMNKLVKDGYAEHKEIEDVETKIKHSTYFLTYDGLILIKNGGYKGEFERQNSKQILDYTLAVSIVICGLVTCVYYVREMLCK